jgi:putative ABC transport system permease protein
MKIKDLLAETFLSLTANKARSFLTILGIVVGIASVITMVALGQGTSASIESSISSMGANLLTISPGGSSSRMAVGGFGQSANTASLTLKDVSAIESQVADVKAVAPVISSSATASHDASNTSVTTYGTTTDYQTVRSLSIQTGSWFTTTQQDNGMRVAVLGPTTAETLFGSVADAIGEQFRLGGQQFTVVGVTVAKGGTSSSSDDAIYIPMITMERYISGLTSGLSTIYVEASSQSVMDTVDSSITDLLLARHKIADSTQADFSIMSQSDLSSTLTSTTETLTILLGSVAGISLLVGGIGIMNMMLTSVTERIREIGLRMSIGATPGDLTLQFLFEAVTLTLIGGLIGIAVGWGISLAISTFSSYAAEVNMSSVLLAVGVSTTIGVIFGFYPARRAAKLDPIEALRYQ